MLVSVGASHVGVCWCLACWCMLVPRMLVSVGASHVGVCWCCLACWCMLVLPRMLVYVGAASHVGVGAALHRKEHQSCCCKHCPFHTASSGPSVCIVETSMRLHHTSAHYIYAMLDSRAAQDIATRTKAGPCHLVG
jgi:hypothetical protein